MWPLEPWLRFEGCNTDKALTDPASEFYGRADAFAMDKYTFYECFSCKVTACRWHHPLCCVAHSVNAWLSDWL